MSGPGEIATVSDLIRTKASKNETKPLVHFDGESVTYDEINRRATAVACGLTSHETGKGDHVGVLLPNSIEYLSIFFAVAKLGAIIVPLNTSLEGEDLAYHIRNSDVEKIVVHESRLGNYQAVRDDVNPELEIVVGPSVAEGMVQFDELRERETSLPDVTVEPEDPFSIIHTSGTTGLPKGVILPHRSYLITGREYAKNIELGKDDIWYTSLPLFHANTQQTTLMGSMLNDRPFVLGPRFSASKFWERVDEYEATIFSYIGSIISILHKRDEGPEQTSLRLGVGGGAPAEMIRAFEREYDLKLLEGYGLTEMGTSMSKVRPEMNPKERYETEGKPVSFVDVAVLDDDDNELPPGSKGEIAARPLEPYSMMLEYYDRPEATVSAWRNLWFHTGDLGYFDEHGNLHFVDRKTFSIRRRGENISSQEVEQVILQHPDVEEVAVVGVDSELGDEEVKGYVVGDVEPASVVDVCDGELADFKIPRYVEVVDELPRTETERVQKQKLSERGIVDAWDRETQYAE